MTVQRLRVDDIDGSPGAEQVTIEVFDQRCQIDLGPTNQKVLTETLAPYFEAGKVTTINKRKDLKQIREWAAQHGHEVPARGRIPTSVIEAYDESRS